MVTMISSTPTLHFGLMLSPSIISYFILTFAADAGVISSAVLADVSVIDGSY